MGVMTAVEVKWGVLLQEEQWGASAGLAGRNIDHTQSTPQLHHRRRKTGDWEGQPCTSCSHQNRRQSPRARHRRTGAAWLEAWLEAWLTVLLVMLMVMLLLVMTAYLMGVMSAAAPEVGLAAVSLYCTCSSSICHTGSLCCRCSSCIRRWRTNCQRLGQDRTRTRATPVELGCAARAEAMKAEAAASTVVWWAAAQRAKACVLEGRLL